MLRYVVYAPTLIGGLGVMDLRIEQPYYALHTTIGHMRRQDKAGKSIEATMHHTQIEI